MKKYPVWIKGVTPHTDPKAKINRFRDVTNVRAIKVINASYRSASLSGVFELENQNEDPIDETPKGKILAKVICAWHGVVPPRTYPRLNLDNADYTVLENYTGQVADNIARSAKGTKSISLTNDTIDRDIQRIFEDLRLADTEKNILIQSRVGQGKFRESLVSIWGGCAVTKCKEVPLLVASHIKPWSKSNNQERLDPNNGFLLLPNIDKAFDLGYISFDSSGKILISNIFPEYSRFGISKTMNIELREGNKNYLEYHRTHVFKAT